jgi:hypothetical protein
MLLSSSACQQTRDADFIVKKDTERMVDLASEGKSGTAISSLGTPDENYIYNATDTSGKVQIKVNAEIILPDTEYLPIVRVSMGGYAEQDVKNLYVALCSNATPVSSDAAFPKGYYQSILDELIEMRQSGNLDKYDSVEELDAAIKKVMNDTENAPENVEPIVPDFSFGDYGNGHAIARILCISENAIMSDLLVINNNDGGGGGHVEYIRDNAYWSEFSRLNAAGHGARRAYSDILNENYVAPATSEQEAFNVASKVISTLGLTDFSCTGKRMGILYNPLVYGTNGERKGLYEFMFTRSINGVSITYTNDDIAADPESPNNVAKPWMYEKIRIFVDDKGVFALVWNAPYVIGELVNANATLLPFGEIKKVFERMIMVKNEQFNDGNIADDIVIEIKQIRLGLARVIEKNNNSNALFVPVWDFFGIKTRQGVSTGMDGYQSLLTINAIDGSIIDRSLGY